MTRRPLDLSITQECGREIEQTAEGTAIRSRLLPSPNLFRPTWTFPPPTYMLIFLVIAT
jgi:hypothetical protein